MLANRAKESARILVLQPYLRPFCGCRRADEHGFPDDLDACSRTSNEVRLQY